MDGKGRVNKPAIDGIRDRIMKKIIGKYIWFKPKEGDSDDDFEDDDKHRRNGNSGECNSRHKGNTNTKYSASPQKVEAIIFVHATYKSKLQRRLQSKDDIFSSLLHSSSQPTG